MRTLREIEELLPELASSCADELEDQDLDFKQWDLSSTRKAVRTVIEWAICMANGGGGTVVFGVADHVTGRGRALVGVPPEVDVNRLKLAVYDATDPKLTPEFEELHVPEGTGRLVVMQIHAGIPPYTDTAGRGSIRVGKDCKPLTGTLRRKLSRESDDDFTVTTVDGRVSEMISVAAIERLRELAHQENAPQDFLQLKDEALLEAIGVLRNGNATRAAILLAGSSAAIHEHIPAYVWTHLRMTSDLDYTDRADGHDAIPVALSRLLDRILADNPIETVRRGLYHFEYRTYPEVALREALLNAFCHADHRIATPIMVKQFPRRIEMTNAGGLIGGITPENILHSVPAARNPCLVDALIKLRLVNRSNLGMQRIFSHLLMEGKEPPLVQDLGEAFQLTFRASKMSAAFRGFVAEEGGRGVYLSVDHLLVLRYLLRFAEIEAPAAAKLCQRPLSRVRLILSEMERDFGYLERGGSGKGAYWALRTETHTRVAAPGDPERDRRLDWEAAKTRVLSVIRRRARQGDTALANADVRRITALDRKQVNRLIHELADEGGVRIEGHGRAAKYVLTESSERED